MYKIISSLHHHGGQTPSWTVFFWSSSENGQLKRICMTSPQLSTDIAFSPDKLPDILNLVELLEDLPVTIAKSLRRSFDPRESEWQRTEQLPADCSRLTHWLENRLEPLQERLEASPEGNQGEPNYDTLKGQAYCFTRRSLIDRFSVSEFFVRQKSDNPFSETLDQWLEVIREIERDCKSREFSTLAKSYGLLASLEAYSEAFRLLGSYVKPVVDRGVPVVTSETLSSAARIWSDTQGSGLNWMPYTQQFRRFITDD